MAAKARRSVSARDRHRDGGERSRHGQPRHGDPEHDQPVAESVGPGAHERVAEQHEERGAEGDEPQRPHHGGRLGRQVRAAVQRRREVERQHAVAAVADEHLGGHEGREQHDGGGDEPVVAGVVGDLLGVEQLVGDQHGGAHEHDGGEVGDGDRHDREHLVAGQAAEPQGGPGALPRHAADRTADARTGAVVAGEAGGDDAGVAACGIAHDPTTENRSSSVRRRRLSRRSRAPAVATAAQAASSSASSSSPDRTRETPSRSVVTPAARRAWVTASMVSWPISTSSSSTPAGVPGQFVHRALGDEDAVVQGHHVVADLLDLFEHVRRQDDVDPEVALDLHDQPEHVVALHGVESVGGFVEHDQPRIGGDRLGELGPLTLAGRHGAERPESFLAQADEVERIARSGPRLVAGQALHLGEVADEVVGPHVVGEDVAFGPVPDAGAEFGAVGSGGRARAPGWNPRSGAAARA